jgi:hypothetical protein
MTAYLVQCVGEGTLPAKLAQVLRQRAAGNPLFLVMDVNELVRQGILREGAGGWEAAVRGGTREPAPLICGRKGAATISGTLATGPGLAAVLRCGSHPAPSCPPSLA